MPGLLCTGATLKDANVKNSKAYCEGMAYRQSDTALNAPKEDNPHAAGSDASDAWDTGWGVADAAAGGNMSKADLGCCSVPLAVT